MRRAITPLALSAMIVAAAVLAGVAVYAELYADDQYAASASSSSFSQGLTSIATPEAGQTSVVFVQVPCGGDVVSAWGVAVYGHGFGNSDETYLTVPPGRTTPLGTGVGLAPQTWADGMTALTLPDGNFTWAVQPAYGFTGNLTGSLALTGSPSVVQVDLPALCHP